MNNSITKKCTRCKKVKNVFPKNHKMRDGFSSWCLDCKNEFDKEYSRKLRKEHPEKTRAAVKKYAKSHPETTLRKVKKYQAAHPEVAKAWRLRNKEKLREQARERYAKNPEKEFERVRNYRARKIGNGGKITATEWKELKKHYNYKCLCCKQREPEIKLEPDHIIPLVLGGMNVIDNIQPLCRSCNASKSGRTIDYR